MGDKDGAPVVCGVVLLLIAIFFAILTIAVPLILVVSGSTNDYCTNATSLNVKEQMFCQFFDEGDLDETWETEVQYPDDVNVYLIRPSDIDRIKTTIRTASYTHSTRLSRSYDEWSLSIVGPTVLELSVSCLGSACPYVNLYWLTHAKYLYAVDDGTFYESRATDYASGFSSTSRTISINATTDDFYHLMFSNSNYMDATVSYSVRVTYTVFDPDSLPSPQKCTECKFSDLEKGDAILIDYPSGTNIEMDANIHNHDVDWSAVIGCAISFLLLTLFFGFFACVFLWKVIKKGKKIAKKASKKVEKKVEANVAAATVASQPAPVMQPAPAGYVDPNYSQPYPGQPYPGQAYPAQQPYPGQDYPAQPQQPYPAPM